jgi:hypothetical protein
MLAIPFIRAGQSAGACRHRLTTIHRVIGIEADLGSPGTRQDVQSELVGSRMIVSAILSSASVA